MPRRASLLLLLLLLACSHDLTRSRVADLIRTHATFAAPVVALPLQEEGLFTFGLERDAGVIEGIWTRSIRSDFSIRYTLTSKGRQYFARDFSAQERMPLGQPARRELLEVTGITTPPMGGEAAKLATFTWQYAGLSPVIARYAGEASVIHEGEALFQLFDDGWRLQQLELHDLEGRIPFQWSPDLEHQAQQAQALQELPPAIAALVSRSSSLEVTAYNKDKGAITLRNKATGETVTVTIQDIEQGRVSFN